MHTSKDIMSIQICLSLLLCRVQPHRCLLPQLRSSTHSMGSTWMTAGEMMPGQGQV